ncbi:MAG: hypothetical protein JXQ96_12930 [Cyclobacteriaceae bacterium]
MEPFEYVVVLTSLIIGLGIAQILTGVADMVAQYRKIKISAPHIIYVIVIFFLHIQEWWINYEYAKHIDVWSLQAVFGILVYPILLFIQARLLFPTGLRSRETDMVEYYEDQWRWLFSIGAWTVIISIWHNVLIQKIPLIEQIPQFGLLAAYMSYVIFNVKNKVAHIVFLSLILVALLVYIATDTQVLTMEMK